MTVGTYNALPSSPTPVILIILYYYYTVTECGMKQWETCSEESNVFYFKWGIKCCTCSWLAARPTIPSIIFHFHSHCRKRARVQALHRARASLTLPHSPTVSPSTATPRPTRYRHTATESQDRYIFVHTNLSYNARPPHCMYTKSNQNTIRIIIVFCLYILHIYSY